MDGVVLVALPAGTLHLSRSLSSRFDRRHPRADRMNLAALVFALHNFADNTIMSDEHQEEESEGAKPAAIALFATPDEQLAAALSPSRKLLVALFTSSSVDSDAAKYIARAIARNLEKTDSVDARIMATLNHVPGLLRSALTRAVESLIDRQLSELGSSIHRVLGVTAAVDGVILGFYYRHGSGHKPDADADEDIALQTGTGESTSLGKAPTAALTSETRPAQPPSKLTRLPSRIEACSSVFLSTRSLLASPRVAPDHGGASKKTKHKKNRKKNAVVDHAESRVFQRCIRLGSSRDLTTVESQSSSSVASEQLAGLVGSLLDAVPVSDQTDKPTTSTRLRVLTWRNPPVRGLPSQPDNSNRSHQDELVAWQQGHGVVYCLLPSSDAPHVANNTDIRLQVVKFLATADQAVRGMLSA